ncbi:MAG: purine-nucleoside phosphorylase, partial [Chloroflexi bacterium]|nr:purine-nucleoside phosphorylase [Chloroflexota bacterium]
GMPFVSMGRAYDPDLLEFASAAAGQSGVDLRKGTYAMVCGPSYETPSELRLLRAIGADAVGMSTAPEVVVARHCGMRVLGISCITNLATGADHTEVGHHDVLAQGRLVVPRLSSLIRGVLRLLPRSA